ncbi:hypothetical protein ERJ75_000793200 [Trypanosoma vivax]|uniref:Uncharacterized protein n=1 Tax=Trypanosoma vivax (strain Y486) TaxID=1055687 RepID=G0U8P5_TRYVY|nr:hypothetical protein ERJ75_000793200 [Trypanosoma vivax]CCC53973.1 conserved hypothetical protein [Trypanosoma vivax Y486]
MSRRATVGTRHRSKANDTSSVEGLVERVFISSPRVFSFSHRVLPSIRHPYIAVILDMVNSDGYKKASRVEVLLGALTEYRDEERKWTRVGSMFDTKLTAEMIDTFRRKVSLDMDVMMCIEKLWNNLGGPICGAVREEEYRAFHYKLFSYLLNIDDVSVVTSTSTAIAEDYVYDERNNNGVVFESFAISVLELADNWTKSREVRDFVHFLTDINNRCSIRKAPRLARHVLPYCEGSAYFAGGVVSKAKEGDKEIFVRTRLQ